MSRHTLYNTISELASPIAASFELEIWGIEVMTGARGALKIFLTGKDGDVGIDECARFSRLFGLALEVEDAFDGPYTLEVSSPGLERTFFTPEQLCGYAGKNVSVALKAPADGFMGRKRFWGELVKAEGEDFSVQVMDAPEKDGARPVIDFSWADLKTVSLKHFLPEDEDQRPGKGRKAPKKSPSGAECGKKTGVEKKPETKLPNKKPVNSATASEAKNANNLHPDLDEFTTKEFS